MILLVALTACVRPEIPASEPVWTLEAAAKPNARRLVLGLPTAETLDVVCSAHDDPEERVGARAAVPARQHEVVVHGLLHDTDYTCAWTAGAWTDEAHVHTGPAPEWVPTWTVEGSPGWGQWTLFNTGRTQDDLPFDQQILIVDGRGRLRWAHRLEPDDVFDLDASYIGDGEILFGGGYGVRPQVVDLSGELLRRAIASSTGKVYHHHTERLDTGEVLALALEDHTSGDLVYEGFTIEILDPTLQSRTWVWNSQRGLDDGWLKVPESWDDPFHANAVQKVGGAVFVNVRHTHQLVKLDQATGARIWSLGVGGDFVLIDVDGQPLGEEDWAWGPHAPEVDGDRVRFYDNGWRRPTPEPYSRVLELQLDEQAMTATLVWEYTEPGWFNRIWGDVDRLPSDGVLVTRGSCDVCVTGPTQLFEVSRPHDEVVWRLTMNDPEVTGYRAQRLDACELFDHRGLCQR